jgi:undecaprenyl-diphosphatase
MTLIQALVMGIVQGATEYIPVSSSAHLVLVPWLLGWPDAPFTFEVLVQWGTLVGVFVYFWRDLWDMAYSVVVGLVRRQPLGTDSARMGWYIVLGTIPAVVFGFLLKDVFEAAYAAPVAVALTLFGTAAILMIAEHLGRRTRTVEDWGWLDSLIVGFWQVLALFPGISRSGATIGGGMLRNFDRPAAARFSFLLSVPALLGAGILAIADLLGTGALRSELPALAVGVAAAAITGYLCIRWLLGYLQHHSLRVFAIYCALFGLFCIIVALIGR